jgi:hypothetical protein
MMMYDGDDDDTDDTGDDHDDDDDDGNVENEHQHHEQFKSTFRFKACIYVCGLFIATARDKIFFQIVIYIHMSFIYRYI